MCKIVVFTNNFSEVCEFFSASRFLIFDKINGAWEVTSEIEFEKIVPSTPSNTRKLTAELLDLIEGCNILAGGTLVGIPYSVFDRAGFHIFEIGSTSDEIFDGIIEDVQNADRARNIREKTIAEMRPIETDIPGIYILDLITLQSEFPEISSKKALTDFLENTPFLELYLTCKHIPPWIENSGKYNVSIQNGGNDAVRVVITLNRC